MTTPKKAPKRNGSARVLPVRPVPHDCPGFESCASLQAVRDRETVAAKAAADAATAAVKALLDQRLSESDAKLETTLLSLGRLQSEVGIVQGEMRAVKAQMSEVGQLIRQTLSQQQERIDHLEAKLIDEQEKDRDSRADVLAEVQALRREMGGRNAA